MATAEILWALEILPIAVPQTFFDQTERERVLLEHLPQVRHIAGQVHDRIPAHVPLDDLIGAGVMGLMDAVAKFNPAKNVPFKLYAQFRIRGAILDSLRKMDWSPRHLRRQARCIEKVTRELRLHQGYPPCETELASKLGMSLEAFQHLLGDLHRLDLGSLQEESIQGTSQEDANSCRQSAAGEDPFLLCLRGEIKSLIFSAIAALDEKAREVVTLHDLQELTMKEVGARLGVGESRVSQIHSAALVRLRTTLEGMIGASPFGTRSPEQQSRPAA